MQFEDLIKIQMSKSKMLESVIFAGQSPYFNYNEFIKERVEATERNGESITKSINWKSKEFDNIVSSEIERRLQLLRRYRHISISNTEQYIQTGITIHRKLRNNF